MDIHKILEYTENHLRICHVSMMESNVKLKVQLFTIFFILKLIIYFCESVLKLFGFLIFFILLTSVINFKWVFFHFIQNFVLNALK